MTDVEQKVVQMRFDDKEFDEKAKKTMKTLDKLNEKLSFDAVASKSDAALNEIVDNVEKIADKAYTIVDRVIDKIKDNIANNIFSFINDTLVGQVKTGWQKYADMTKAVGSLSARGYGMEQISKVLERLSFFSDETSYNFNDMLNNINRFVSSGVSLEDAEKSLEGIAGLAGVTGVNAETASRAMYQMSQAMGSFMKAQDWMSISTANLDTLEFKQSLIDTAVELGTLKKAGKDTYVSLRATNKKGAEAFSAEQGFVESLTTGAWVTKDVMVETYKKYSSIVDKVHQEVKASNGTLYAADVLGEMKETNNELIKQYMEMFHVTEDIAVEELDKINKVKKATEEEIQQYMKLKKVSRQVAESTLNKNYENMLKDFQKRTKKTLDETEQMVLQFNGWTDSLGLKAFANSQEARTFEDVINSVKEAVSSNWRSIYTSIFGDYQEAKALWSDMADGLVDLFAGRMYEIAAMFEEWKEKGGRNTLWQGLYAFGSGFYSLIDNIRKAWDELVSGGMSGAEKLLHISDQIKEAGFKFYIFMRELGRSDFYQNIAGALLDIRNFLDQIFGALHDGVRDAVPSGQFLMGLLTEFASIIKEITSNFKLSDAAVDGLRRTFKGLTIILLHSKKTFVQLLVKVILPVLNVAFEILGEIVEVVVTLTGVIGDILEYFMPLNSESSSLVTILEVLSSVITTVIRAAGTLVTYVLKNVVPMIGLLIGLVSGMIDNVANLFNGSKIKMGAGDNKLVRNFGALKKAIEDAWAPLKSFSEIIDEYRDGKGLINFLSLFSDITDGIGNRLLLTLDATVGFLQVMGESKFGKAMAYALKALQYLVRAGLWLFNNLFMPIVREIITELGLTAESVRAIIANDGILGILKLIQEIFRTGIFGEIVATIQMFNNLIGSNGLGKIFKNGAKALESIAEYFDAAKMNTTIDIVFKLIGAMTLLYALLAMIAFIPEEHMQKMKKAMIDFAISLGIIVSAVFVISAAASLAGGHLIALAASFVTVALAIWTAMNVMERMVEFVDKVEQEKINSALDVMGMILKKFGSFIVSVITPIAIAAGKFEADIGGVGIAMAGLAASVLLLLKAAKNVEGVDPSAFDSLLQFLSGVYMVLTLSTALLVMASAGKDVHGISIAIASVGVAFAAIKLILPLCKDVIAQKDVLLEGQGALATFGLFMVAFAASMYFIVSSVDGIISSIASLFILKAYIAIFNNQILPTILNTVAKVINLAEIMAGLSQDHAGIEGAIIGAMALIVSVGAIFLIFHRYLLDTFSDFDPVSIVAICIAILGGIIAFSELLLPALIEFNREVIQKNNAAQLMALETIIGEFVAMLGILMLGFFGIVWSYVDMYDEVLKGFRVVNINAGLITKEYNGLAQMFSSISTVIIAIMAGMAGILYIAGKLDVTPEKYKMMDTMMNNVAAIMAIILVGLNLLFITITAIMSSMNFTSSANTFQIAGGLVYNNINPLVSVIKYISNVMEVLAIFVPMFMIIIAGIALLVQETHKNAGASLDQIIHLVEELAYQMRMIFMMIGLIGALLIMPMIHFSGAGAGGIMTGAASQIGNSFQNVASALKYITLSLAAIFGVFALVAMIISDYDPVKFGQFKESIHYFGVMLIGTVAALTVFTAVISYFTNKFSKEVTTITNGAGATGIKGWFTPFSTMLVGMIGLVLSLLVLGSVLIPAIAQFKDMDLDKMILAFKDTIIMLGLAIFGMVAALAIDRTGLGQGNTGKSLISTLKTLLLIIAPMLSLAISFNYISMAMKEMASIDPKIWPMVGAVLGGMLLFIVGLVAGLTVLSKYTPAVILGKIAAIMLIVGGVIVAVGVAAYLIGEAALMIAKAYIAWSEYQLGVKKLTAQIASMQSNPIAQMTEGMKDDGQEAVDTAEGILDDVKDVSYGAVHSKSPSKDFRQLGKYIDKGLVLGLKDGSKEVSRTSANLAENSVEAPFSDTLEIASPSKVFYKNGRFIVAGLENGIKSGKNDLSAAMSDIGENLSASLQAGFDNLDFDILGGKTLDQLADEFMGNLDGTTIIGKLFGLDDLTDEEKKIVEAYQLELDAINKAAAEAGGISPGAAQRASFLQGQIDQITNKSQKTRLVDRTKDLLNDFVGDFSLKETLVKVGNELGLNITEGATGETIISDLVDKVTGKDGLLDKITGYITDFDWTNVGTTVGGQLLSGIGTALSPLTNVIKRLIHRASDEYTSVDMFDRSKFTRASQGGKEYQSLKFRDSSYEILDDKEYLKKSEERLGELYALGGTEIIIDPEQVNTSKLLSAMDDDFEKRFPQFMEAIAGDRVFNEYTGKMEYFLTAESYKAINALLDAWGIASPSKVMRYIYGQINEGAIVEIQEGSSDIAKAFEDSTSEQYRALSLGLQGIDQLMEDNSLEYTPSIVPVIDTAGFGTLNSLMSPYMNGKVTASLDFTNSFGTIATAQQALANAVNSMARDIIGALNIGELIKVDVNSTVNDNNLFDHFVTIDRQEYNRTGHHAW